MPDVRTTGASLKGGRVQLPDRPNLRHLKDQAKDLLDRGEAESLADAQFKIARLYEFASWPKLKAHVDSLEKDAQLAALKAEIAQLARAVDRDDLARVQELMTRHPALHRAPLGYGRSGPLTCATECPVPPTTTRLAIVRWMIEDGSDVHQGGDAPLMRAALGRRIPMMELLVSCGADVNAMWDGNFPIIFAACEDVDPVAIKWLLDHGANPNAGSPDGKFAYTALDYVIGSYVRSPELARCIDLLLGAGGITKYNVLVPDLLRGGLDQLRERLDADPALVNRRFPELDFGTTGGRMLTLARATLLHVAAEYGRVEAATLLLNRGADVNARSSVDAPGVGGQTPIFHAATQFENRGLPMLQLLIERGADLSVRAKVPGHYERPGEMIECTALGYAVRFMDETRRGDKSKTVALLRAHGAIE
jgi:ankyrin repeat protein